MPIFYPIVIGFPLIYFWISDKLRLKIDFILFLGIIIHSILLANRFAVGADLAAYKIHYEIYQSGYLPIAEFADIGYVSLVRLSSYLNFNFTTFLFLSSLFNLGSLMFYVKKYPITDKVTALCLYLLYFDLFIYSLSAIRQSFAISFLMLAVVALREKHKILAITLIGLGSLFHWTLVGVFPAVYFIYKFRQIRPINLLIFIILVPTVYYIVANSSLMTLLGRINYNTELYLNVLTEERSTDLLNFIISWGAALFFVLFLSFFKRLKDNGIVVLNKISFFKEKISLTFEEWSIIIFLTLHACTDLYYISALPRFEMYFYSFLPFILVEKINLFEGRGKYLFRFLCIFLFIIQFYFKLQINSYFYKEAQFLF